MYQTIYDKYNIQFDTQHLSHFQNSGVEGIIKWWERIEPKGLNQNKYRVFVKNLIMLLYKIVVNIQHIFSLKVTETFFYFTVCIKYNMK